MGRRLLGRFLGYLPDYSHVTTRYYLSLIALDIRLEIRHMSRE